MNMQHQEVLDAAVKRYSDALKKRIAAGERLASAQKEDLRASRVLAQERDSLRTIEQEMTEGIRSPHLRLSSEVLKVVKQPEPVTA